MSGFAEFLNGAGKAFVGFAWPMLVQSSLLIVAVLMLDRLLRKRTKAVVRYGIWMLVLLKLVLPPSLASPTSLVAWIGARLPDLSSPVETTMEAPPMTPPVASVPATSMPPFESHVAPPAEHWTAPPAPSEPVPATVVQPVLVPEPTPPLTWQAVAFLAWLAIVAIMLVLLIQRAFFVCSLVAQ